MTPPVHLDSKTSQEANDNYTTVFISEWSKAAINTIHESFIILDIRTQQQDPETLYTASAYFTSHRMCSTLHPRVHLSTPRDLGIVEQSLQATVNIPASSKRPRILSRVLSKQAPSALLHTISSTPETLQFKPANNSVITPWKYIVAFKTPWGTRVGVNANSSAGKGGRSPRSGSAGSSNPTTNFYSVKINQIDNSALTSLTG